MEWERVLMVCALQQTTAPPTTPPLGARAGGGGRAMGVLLSAFALTRLLQQLKAQRGESQLGLLTRNTR